ncbi:MAG: biopolymer transporter ExbD [Verrucomicrobiota bacterium]
MRFPRNVKPFRGQIDLAPLAGVLFLLLIFILLASLVYTPGVPIQLSSASANAGAARRNLLIKAQGEIHLGKQIYQTNSMEQLRAELKNLALPATLVVEAEKDAPRNVLIEVREMARGLRLGFEVLGAPIELPPAANFVGVAGATAVVAVNLAGQFFFENQLIGEQQLKMRLAERVRQSRLPLTLIVLADKGVEYDFVMRLAQIAQQAGIQQATLQIKPVAAKTFR